MMERFAKLLLGEDMSGGGKGVCTALAISNAITNLSGLSILKHTSFFSWLKYIPIIRGHLTKCINSFVVTC